MDNLILLINNRNTKIKNLFKEAGLDVTLHNDIENPVFILDDRYKLPIRVFKNKFLFLNKTFAKENNKKYLVDLKRKPLYDDGILYDIKNYIDNEVEKLPFFSIVCDSSGMVLSKFDTKSDGIKVALFGINDHYVFHEKQYTQELIDHLHSIGYTNLRLKEH